MSVILQPQRAFPIVRQIANHLDATTYYVRAVVRDADGTTLDTVNLASQGNQRYQTSWQVPADPSGQGRYISIVTSVYTDSGYTSKSDNYGDEENTYLIFDRVMPAMRGGGGLDSRSVRRIIGEELDKRKPEKITIPKPKEYAMRWDEVLAAIRRVQEAVSAIPTNQTDLSPVLTAVGQAVTAIEQKEVTPPTDMTAAVKALEAVDQAIQANLRQIALLIQSKETELAQQLVDRFGDDILKKLEEVVADTTFTIGATTAKMETKAPEATNEPEFDMNKLAI